MKSINEIAAMLAEQRKSLGIEQKDMYLRIGMKQQQYQRIEAGSDVKLSTLLRVLEGLGLELSIAPKGRKATVLPTESMPINLNKLGKDSCGLEDDSDDLGFWFDSEDN
ncbi:helix-turn-helix domain-containing protein [Aliivibrio fischeri]|uniref:helix-turn-helix domain-containing protein n=1 Tax=Aliivibrio fischeri TaxID=668 RepID=UPI0002E40B5D|nr:helix-turn-helix transcriptional regulator [Aliivibrio fischeri]OEE25425.1 transcriptional regulator [Aliivibrio fischeri ZF-211]